MAGFYPKVPCDARYRGTSGSRPACVKFSRLVKGGLLVTDRDRRLAMLIIGLLLAIPLLWALTTFLVEQVVQFFL